MAYLDPASRFGAERPGFVSVEAHLMDQIQTPAVQVTPELSFRDKVHGSLC